MDSKAHLRYYKETLLKSPDSDPRRAYATRLYYCTNSQYNILTITTSTPGSVCPTKSANMSAPATPTKSRMADLDLDKPGYFNRVRNGLFAGV